MTRKFFCFVPVFILCVFLLGSKAYSQDLPKFDVPGASKSKSGGDKGGSKANEPGINDFIPVETQPAITKRAMPEYPPLAKTARIEGTVWVKVLVDKTGKAKKAVTIKTDAEVFNESAETATMKSSFSPAVMNGINVDCWVVVTYSFKIK
jgi:TonB family protein